jgi:hypothetical protein
VTRFLQLAAAIAVALPALVCAQQQPQPAPAPATVAGDGDEAARVGDRVITVKDVDAAWREADPASHGQAAQALYEGRRQALDRLVADILVADAAKAKGVSAEQLTKDEIARRTKAVADADIDAFYRQNVSRMQGKSVDEMRGLIRGFLEQQQQQAARAAFVSELRNAAAVRVALEPPRQKIDVAATDPSRGGATAAVVLVEYSDYQ